MGQILSLRHYRDDVIAHSHEHAQVVISLSGKLDFEVDGRGRLLRQQHLIVVPAGAHHTCGSEQGSHCLVLDVPGQDWLAASLGSHANASRRLLELGFLPGTPLRAVRRAPLGDPVQIEVRGYHLSLRNREAAGIRIDLP